MADRLIAFWRRYDSLYWTDTRNQSAHAFAYLNGLLRIEGERNFTAIGQATDIAPQNVQHFMSNSPWSTWETVFRVQIEIRHTPAYQTGGVLLLDESADEKAGDQTVGAGRQYNGRLGKIDMSQVGVFLTFAHPATQTWTWIDGELFLPEHWFSDEWAELRQKTGVPEERTFQTKVELGWTMIERVVQARVPFEAVCADSLYGRSAEFRRNLDEAGLLYSVEVPFDTMVYEIDPTLLDPQTGEPPETTPVAAIALRSTLEWERIEVRPTDRGVLDDRFAAVRVWVPYGRRTYRQEWLVLRKHSDDSVSYALSNASAETPLARLAWLKCARHFVECSIHDAKSEAGWDDLRARKYRAWEHHLALTIVATWFMTQTKLDWQQTSPPDPTLREDLGVEELPKLSLANVRALLRAVLPLRQLSPQDAAELVVKHLVNRTCSRKSRMKNRRRPFD